MLRQSWLTTPGSNCRLIHKSSYLLGHPGLYVDSSAWQHADGLRL
ncbi:hypothetical protein ATKI12_0081 [Kitasatospora sp. Ki12]